MKMLGQESAGHRKGTNSNNHETSSVSNEILFIQQNVKSNTKK